MEDKLKPIALLIILMLFKGLNVHAQSKERTQLYFLADTVHIKKENRILRIRPEMQRFVSYEFFCKCMPNYKANVNVYYEKSKEPNLFRQKPDLKYISWQDLSDLFAIHTNRFDGLYQLEIIEVLPNGDFLKNKVKLVMQHLQNNSSDQQGVKVNP